MAALPASAIVVWTSNHKHWILVAFAGSGPTDTVTIFMVQPSSSDAGERFDLSILLACICFMASHFSPSRTEQASYWLSLSAIPSGLELNSRIALPLTGLTA